VSIRGVGGVVGVECTKLAAQIKTQLILWICIIGPFVFAAAIRLQSSLPTDTLFGRAVKESGFAVSLVVLGFAALWVVPVLASVVGGDLFSSEDRYGTWKMVLTRSRSRGEIFAGKLIVALGFSFVAIVVLAVSSLAAGIVTIGPGSLIDLSGAVRAPGDALRRVALAWMSIVPAAFTITALAVLLSVVSRSSIVGIGVPVIAALTMQLGAMVDGPDIVRRLLITSGFEAWHGLLANPPFYTPLVRGAIVSAVYFVTCIAIAYHRLRWRDITG
jgi:ABC-2 type transport system permease protein